MQVKGGRKKRKMGNIVSKKKEKEKERKQGLMKQMQSKAGVSLKSTVGV